MVTKLFTNPDAFFAERADEARLRWPALVVVAAGATSAGTTFAVAPKVLESIPESIEAFAVVGFGIGSLYSFVSAVMIWIVYSGVFFLLSHHLGGDGEFRRLVRLTGWGFLPAVVSGIVGFVALMIALDSVSGGAASREQVLAAVQSHPAMRASELLGQLLFLWQGILWVFAVKWARDLSLRRAAITVAVPVAVSFLASLV